MERIKRPLVTVVIVGAGMLPAIVGVQEHAFTNAWDYVMLASAGLLFAAFAGLISADDWT